ncbi:ABC transporter permease [Aestuariivirga sp.]|uniref:ABC transporter permease n=1 Tax=Aestuariivirga sp. TaxID=2650926 RepID=UPI0039E5C4C9
MTRENLLKWAPLLVLLALVLFFSAINPNFLSLRNFARLSIVASPALMVAVGVTFIIIMGSIDLSMEGAVSALAVIFCYLLVWLGGSVAGIGFLAIPAILLLGFLVGAVNGLIHVRLRIPSFMSSLAMGFVGTGAAVLMTGGNIVKIDDEVFRSLLTYRVLGFPLMAYAAFAFLLLGWVIQSYTRLGRNFYAVGGGEDLAHASGVNVKRVRVLGFALAGFYFAIAGLLQVAKLGQAESVTGSNLMFISITSVVVGGVALWGGIGGVWNAFVGVLIVAVINNGMIVIGIPDFIQDGLLGLLVIIAVILSTDRRSVAFVK